MDQAGTGNALCMYMKLTSTGPWGHLCVMQSNEGLPPIGPPPHPDLAPLWDPRTRAHTHCYVSCKCFLLRAECVCVFVIHTHTHTHRVFHASASPSELRVGVFKLTGCQSVCLVNWVELISLAKCPSCRHHQTFAQWKRLICSPECIVSSQPAKSKHGSWADV